MVSSRSGLVDKSATGQPTNSSTRRTYLIAAAGKSAQDRARAVGVRAAVPLGVCLLPSFLLLGIVPLAVSLATSIVG